MLKWIGGLIAVVAIVAIAQYTRYGIAMNAIGNIEKSSLKLQENLKKQSLEATAKIEEINKQKQYKAHMEEIVDVEIKPKALDECFKIQGSRVITNQVLECTQGKHLRMRRNEAEKLLHLEGKT